MKYNSVYFLHIPKTNGRTIRNLVLLPLEKKLNENGIRIIISHKEAHLGWHTEIDRNTYVISSLRDPAEQTASLYCHLVCGDGHGGIKENYDKNFLSLDKFLNFAMGSSFGPNFQSRSFFYSEGENEYSKMYSQRYIVNKNELYKKLAQVSLFLDAKTIGNRYIEIQKKIISDLGLNIEPEYVDTKDHTDLKWHNPESSILYNKLTERQKDQIRAHNVIDNELYNLIQFWDIKDTNE